MFSFFSFYFSFIYFISIFLRSHISLFPCLSFSRIPERVRCRGRNPKDYWSPFHVDPNLKISQSRYGGTFVLLMISQCRDEPCRWHWCLRRYRDKKKAEVFRLNSNFSTFWGAYFSISFLHITTKTRNPIVITFAIIPSRRSFPARFHCYVLRLSVKKLVCVSVVQVISISNFQTGIVVALPL